MKKNVFGALFLLIAFCAQANPVSINGQSLLAFAMVAFWALVIESAVAAITLASCGPSLFPLFSMLGIANILVFVFAFLPLMERVSLWLLEAGVVAMDAVCIRLVLMLPFVQGVDFIGVSWRRCLLASLLGNTASFFVGVLAAGAPWADRPPPGAD